MHKKVLILDYHLGNLFSVEQACKTIGVNAFVSSDKSQINKADAIILPGVGAFPEAMRNLKKMDLISPIIDFVEQCKPLFGICLGLQLLFTESEEFESGKGLGIIKGSVRKISFNNDKKEIFKVPQIGWNKIKKWNNTWHESPLTETKEGEYVYFVHSYYVIPENESDKLSVTDYGGLEYCSAIMRGKTIFATQFHPEKSAQKGLSIYKNWAIQNNLI